MHQKARWYRKRDIFLAEITPTSVEWGLKWKDFSSPVQDAPVNDTVKVPRTDIYKEIGSSLPLPIPICRPPDLSLGRADHSSAGRRPSP